MPVGMAYERKSYEFKGTLDENCIKGDAAVMGNLDYGRDVIFPGAFKGGVLANFLKNGFVSIGHDWLDLPVAIPKVAKEIGNKLYSEAIFHSTARAQDARVVASERLANGLNMGLSIGFMPSVKGTFWFDNGEDLLAYAKENGFQMDLFDQQGLAKDKNRMRGLTRIDEVMEYSIVPAPMNPMASATEAKMFSMPAIPGYNLVPIPVGADDAGILAVVKQSRDFRDASDGRDMLPPSPLKGELASAIAEVKVMVETWRGMMEVEAYFANTEERATADVLDSLCSCMWNCFYDLLFYCGETEPSVDDRVAAIEEAVGIFGAKAVALARAILATDTDALASQKARFDELIELKGVSGSTTLPIAERDHIWDAGGAEKRVKTWAGADEKPNGKFRKAFFWYDGEKPDLFASYKLPFADVINGTLTAIYSGVSHAAGRLDQAQIPDADKAAVKRKIETYYSKFRKKFGDDTITVPWSTGKSLDLESIRSISSEREIERALRDAGLSLEARKAMISRCKAILHRDDGGEQTEGGEAEGKVAAETAETKTEAITADNSQAIDPPGKQAEDAGFLVPRNDDGSRNDRGGKRLIFSAFGGIYSGDNG